MQVDRQSQSIDAVRQLHGRTMNRCLYSTHRRRMLARVGMSLMCAAVMGVLPVRAQSQPTRIEDLVARAMRTSASSWQTTPMSLPKSGDIQNTTSPRRRRNSVPIFFW